MTPPTEKELEAARATMRALGYAARVLAGRADDPCAPDDEVIVALALSLRDPVARAEAIDALQTMQARIRGMLGMSGGGES